MNVNADQNMEENTKEDDKSLLQPAAVLSQTLQTSDQVAISTDEVENHPGSSVRLVARDSWRELLKQRQPGTDENTLAGDCPTAADVDNMVTDDNTVFTADSDRDTMQAERSTRSIVDYRLSFLKTDVRTCEITPETEAAASAVSQSTTGEKKTLPECLTGVDIQMATTRYDVQNLPFIDDDCKTIAEVTTTKSDIVTKGSTWTHWTGGFSSYITSDSSTSPSSEHGSRSIEPSETSRKTNSDQSSTERTKIRHNRKNKSKKTCVEDDKDRDVSEKRGTPASARRRKSGDDLKSLDAGEILSDSSLSRKTKSREGSENFTPPIMRRKSNENRRGSPLLSNRGEGRSTALRRRRSRGEAENHSDSSTQRLAERSDDKMTMRRRNADRPLTTLHTDNTSIEPSSSIHQLAHESKNSSGRDSHDGAENSDFKPTIISTISSDLEEIRDRTSNTSIRLNSPKAKLKEHDQVNTNIDAIKETAGSLEVSDDMMLFQTPSRVVDVDRQTSPTMTRPISANQSLHVMDMRAQTLRNTSYRIATNKLRIAGGGERTKVGGESLLTPQPTSNLFIDFKEEERTSVLLPHDSGSMNDSTTLAPTTSSHSATASGSDQSVSSTVRQADQSPAGIAKQSKRSHRLHLSSAPAAAEQEQQQIQQQQQQQLVQADVTAVPVTTPTKSSGIKRLKELLSEMTSTSSSSDVPNFMFDDASVALAATAMAPLAPKPILLSPQLGGPAYSPRISSFLSPRLGGGGAGTCKLAPPTSESSSAVILRPGSPLSGEETGGHHMGASGGSRQMSPKLDLPLPPVTFEGSLTCKNTFSNGQRTTDRNWRPLYVILRGHALHIHPDSASINVYVYEHPISIKLALVDIAYEEEKKRKRHNVFRVNTLTISEYLFEASDQQCMLNWIEAIRRRSQPSEHKRKEDSSGGKAKRHSTSKSSPVKNPTNFATPTSSSTLPHSSGLTASITLTTPWASELTSSGGKPPRSRSPRSAVKQSATPLTAAAYALAMKQTGSVSSGSGSGPSAVGSGPSIIGFGPSGTGTVPSVTVSGILGAGSGTSGTGEVMSGTDDKTSHVVAGKGGGVGGADMAQRSPGHTAPSFAPSIASILRSAAVPGVSADGSQPQAITSDSRAKDSGVGGGIGGGAALTWKAKMAMKLKRISVQQQSTHSSGSGGQLVSDESSSSCFGLSLDKCCPATSNAFVPRIVEICTELVESKGLQNKGIYRVPGNSAAITALQADIDKDPTCQSLDSEKWNDVNAVISLLKLFFRRLPEPLITDELYQSVIDANRTPDNVKRMLKIKRLLSQLPPHNFETFYFLARHLQKVARHGLTNMMDARNLAIVFGPTLLQPKQENMISMVKDMSDQCRVVESIILNCDWFFGSWDEDVNVPEADGEAESSSMPITGMDRQLLEKAQLMAASEQSISNADKKRQLILRQSSQGSVSKLIPSSGAATRKDKCTSSVQPSTTTVIHMGGAAVVTPAIRYEERNIDDEIVLRSANRSIESPGATAGMESPGFVTTPRTRATSVPPSAARRCDSHAMETMTSSVAASIVAVSTPPSVIPTTAAPVVTAPVTTAAGLGTKTGTVTTGVRVSTSRADPIPRRDSKQDIAPVVRRLDEVDFGGSSRRKHHRHRGRRAISEHRGAGDSSAMTRLTVTTGSQARRHHHHGGGGAGGGGGGSRGRQEENRTRDSVLVPVGGHQGNDAHRHGSEGDASIGSPPVKGVVPRGVRELPLPPGATSDYRREVGERLGKYCLEGRGGGESKGAGDGGLKSVDRRMDAGPCAEYVAGVDGRIMGSLKGSDNNGSGISTNTNNNGNKSSNNNSSNNSSGRKVGEISSRQPASLNVASPVISYRGVDSVTVGRSLDLQPVNQSPGLPSAGQSLVGHSAVGRSFDGLYSGEANNPPLVRSVSVSCSSLECATSGAITNTPISSSSCSTNIPTVNSLTSRSRGQELNEISTTVSKIFDTKTMSAKMSSPAKTVAVSLSKPAVSASIAVNNPAVSNSVVSNSIPANAVAMAPARELKADPNVVDAAKSNMFSSEKDTVTLLDLSAAGIKPLDSKEDSSAILWLQTPEHVLFPCEQKTNRSICAVFSLDSLTPPPVLVQRTRSRSVDGKLNASMIKKNADSTVQMNTNTSLLSSPSSPPPCAIDVINPRLSASAPALFAGVSMVASPPLRVASPVAVSDDEGGARAGVNHGVLPNSSRRERVRQAGGRRAERAKSSHGCPPARSSNVGHEAGDARAVEMRSSRNVTIPKDRSTCFTFESSV